MVSKEKVFENDHDGRRVPAYANVPAFGSGELKCVKLSFMYQNDDMFMYMR